MLFLMKTLAGNIPNIKTIGGKLLVLATVDTDRMWQRLQALAGFTDPDRPWTRRAFSPVFLQAREWLAGEFRAAGLQVRLDSAGNLIGRRQGLEPGLKPLVTGSHSDTVPRGGRFDGALGVIAGLEVAQSLEESGVQLRHPLEVIDFLGEEPSDHGVSCIGSRAFGGHLDAAMLALTDAGGESLQQAMDRVGGNVQALAQACRGPDGIAAFVELHIEQGPVLETEQIEIGVVSHIVGIQRYAITVSGRADHAGTTPMRIRQDALAGAAHVVLEARRLADSYRSSAAYVVATVGKLELTPNAANSVPGRAELVLEVRSDAADILQGFAPQVMASCEQALERLHVTAGIRLLTQTPPVACAEPVMQAIAAAAAQQSLSYRYLPSGAGHDAMHVACTGPMGMIFVPCRQGRSHCPEEWLDKEQAGAGTRVLAHTLIDLDRTLPE